MSKLPEKLRDPKKVLERGTALDELMQNGKFWLASELLTAKQEIATLRQKLHAGAECAEDEIGMSVCEHLYMDKSGEVEEVRSGLSSALRSIYAIAGEDEQISKIVNDAIRKYGGPSL